MWDNIFNLYVFTHLLVYIYVDTKTSKTKKQTRIKLSNSNIVGTY